ncbi:kinase-like domain-containing protein, partial [Crucibulum laeve]
IQRIQRETRIWGCLDHPNILHLLGITFDFGNHMAMVCPWMESGDLNTYLREFKKTLTLSKRLDLVKQYAYTYSIVHSQSVVHGDLTTGNILISQERAILSDFGLSTVVAECQGTSFMSSTVGGAVRWAAPELYEVGIHSEITPIITKSCDIYSLGNVMLQTISGRIPFDHLSTDVLVVMELMKGGHSRRPPETMLTDEFWDLIMKCWGTDMFSRLDVRSARALLHECWAACPPELLTRILANADDSGEDDMVVSG